MNTSNVIFDTKLFDYSKSKGPFVAVPKIYIKQLSLFLKKTKIKKTPLKKSKSMWALSTKDILKSGALAKKEYALGKTIRL